MGASSCPFSLPSSSGAVFQCPRASLLEVSVDLSAGVLGLSSEDLPKPLALGREPVHLCSHRHPCPSTHRPCRTQLLPRGTSADSAVLSLWALLCFPGVHLATLVTSAYPNPQLCPPAAQGAPSDWGPVGCDAAEGEGYSGPSAGASALIIAFAPPPPTPGQSSHAPIF